MKKSLLFVLGIFASTLLSAQVIFQENFSGATFPPSGWMVFGNMQNFSASATNYASGTAPEMNIKGTPTFFRNPANHRTSDQYNRTNYGDHSP